MANFEWLKILVAEQKLAKSSDPKSMPWPVLQSVVAKQIERKIYEARCFEIDINEIVLHEL
mgnify:FL=1